MECKVCDDGLNEKRDKWRFECEWHTGRNNLQINCLEIFFDNKEVLLSRLWTKA